MDYYHDLIPSLPSELGLECLTRLDFSAHQSASQVCKHWRDLIKSRDFYYHRKKTGFTRKSACLVHAIEAQSSSKPVGQPVYGITIFDPVGLMWERLEAVPKYPDGLPMFCQVASTEGKVVVMGGWNPARWEPVRDVFVYEFVSRKWRKCKDMPSVRSFFAVGAAGGKVFVAGGHDQSKNALNSAWAFDVDKNEWTELPKMHEERDECEGLVVGSEFWVVSGYGTESQGEFKSSAEVYNLESGEWRTVENAWAVNRCPRSCVGVDKGKDGNLSLVCWAEADTAVQVAACGVDLADKGTLVTGSAYQGGPHGFYLLDKEKNKQGQNGKLVKVNVPDEFSGFVQSGCCVEI